MPNPAELLVKVDVRRLHANLRLSWGRPLRDSELRDFLVQAGFRPVRDGWIAVERSLMALDPSEVISSVPLESAGRPYMADA
jgi:hypothetical protein